MWGFFGRKREVGSEKGKEMEAGREGSMEAGKGGEDGSVDKVI
jgi:hypothetical protein